MTSLRAELMRKAFHMLSLAYLGFYKLMGYPAVIEPMAVWTAVVLAIETARLCLPRLNEGLTAFFGPLARPEESRRFSGIIHTTAGALLLFALFGERPAIVAAAIYYVAFGDAAAAVFGKAFGRHRIGASRKSVEGTLACLTTCLLIGWAMGFSPAAIVAAAVVATIVEFLPATAWFNDNFWMPLAAATALRLCAS